MYKRFIFLMLISFVSACGFEPLYVERKGDNAWYFKGDFDTSISQEMAKIKVMPIKDRFGQIMRNDLIDLLSPKGQPQKPKYRLFVTLKSKTERDQALRSDITATRKMVKYKVSYYMTDNDKTLLKGDSVAYTGYDILANPYSTTIAKKKGDEDAARIIANDISSRLGAYFHSIATKRSIENDF